MCLSQDIIYLAIKIKAINIGSTIQQIKCSVTYYKKKKCLYHSLRNFDELQKLIKCVTEILTLA